MDQLLQLRERYGEVYVLILPSGQHIPCRPLSVGDYLKYDNLFREGRIPSAYLENEIFRKCVLDNSYIIRIYDLNAGIVSTVATLIMQISAPATLEGLDQHLAKARHEANATLHDLVSYVCQAFPAYKPEDLYDMPFDIFMFRVGMAERKLLNSGMVKEPLSVIDYSKEQPNKRQQKPKSPVASRLNSGSKPEKNVAKEWKQTHQGQQTVIKTADMVEHQAAYAGHEKEDRILNENNMLAETAKLYPEYLAQVKAGQQVAIKSPEERKAAALLRAEESKLELSKMVAKQKVAEQQLTDKLTKNRRLKRTVKKR
jgi:hypothetical protein